EFFQDHTTQLLQLPEPCQILLEFLVQELRILRSQLIPQDHIAQLHRARQQPILPQFFQRHTWIVVVHASPPESSSPSSMARLSCNYSTQKGEQRVAFWRDDEGCRLRGGSSNG